MKFSDYYLAPASRVIASFLGILSGLTVGLFTTWQYGVLAGGVIAIVASVLIPWKVWREEKPYNLLKEKIKGPFLIDKRVRFSIKGGSVGGYFILTDESMIFLSVEDGEHRLEFSKNDVESVVLGNDMTVKVYLNDKQFVRMMSNMVEEIGEILRRNGWRVRSE
ncbi:MAG: hypothetical protein E7637_06955 [Ruminococcaceae bacterium]|nr:hypothetical protein [Oscillospiraceae bacterium]